MDVIVLCGGFGTRLGRLGAVVPKSFLRVNGKPVIDHILSSLEKLDAVSRIIVTTNRKFAGVFKRLIKEKESSGYTKELQLIVEPSTSNENRRGVIGSVFYAIRNAKVDSDMLLIYGDNLYTFDMGEIVKGFLKNRDPCVVAYDVHSLEDARRFGVIEAVRGVVKDVEEKSERPRSTLVSTGIYFYPKDAIGAFGRYVKETGDADSKRGGYMKWLLAHRRVRIVVPKTGRWVDIGSMKGYLQARFISKRSL